MARSAEMLNAVRVYLERTEPQWVFERTQGRPFDFVGYERTGQGVVWVVVDSGQSHLTDQDINVISSLVDRGVKVWQLGVERHAIHTARAQASCAADETIRTTRPAHGARRRVPEGFRAARR